MGDDGTICITALGFSETNILCRCYNCGQLTQRRVMMFLPCLFCDSPVMKAEKDPALLAAFRFGGIVAARELDERRRE